MGLTKVIIAESLLKYGVFTRADIFNSSIVNKSQCGQHSLSQQDKQYSIKLKRRHSNLLGRVLTNRAVNSTYILHVGADVIAQKSSASQSQLNSSIKYKKL